MKTSIAKLLKTTDDFIVKAVMIGLNHLHDSKSYSTPSAILIWQSNGDVLQVNRRDYRFWKVPRPICYKVDSMSDNAIEKRRQVARYASRFHALRKGR